MDNPPEASKHRSPARGDTNDNGHLTEEPCEVETLTHGFEAEPERRRSGLGSGILEGQK